LFSKKEIREGHIFNGKIIQSQFFLKDFLFKSYGFNKQIQSIVQTRFEFDLNIKIRDLNHHD